MNTLKLVSPKNLKSLTDRFVGTDKYKCISETLNTGDVLEYKGYLYKYIGQDNKIFSIPDTENFKKIGLRFLQDEYQGVIYNDYDEVYNHFIKKRDTTRKSFVYLNTNFYEEGDFESSNKYYVGDSNCWTKYIPELNIASGTYTMEQLEQNYPEIVKNLNLKELYLKVKALADDIEYEDCLSEQSLIEKGKKHFPEDNFTTTVRTSAYNNDICIIGEKTSIDSNSDSFTFLEYTNNEYVSSGVYQKEIGKHAKNTNILLPKNERKVYFEYIGSKYTNGYRGYICMKLYNDKHNYYDDFINFWQPYNIDVYSNDSSSSTARELCKKNKYGFFVESKKPGKYTVECKIIYTNIDQCEDAHRPWWMSLYPDKLEYAGTNSSWFQKWDKQNEIECTITYNVSSDMKIENVYFETKDHIQFGKTDYWDVQIPIKNYMEENFKYEVLNNYLFFQVDYATYSYDDKGSWNAWGYSHIIPPLKINYVSD